KFGDAEMEFRRLLALNPGHSKTLLAMGQLLRDRGEFQEAERCLTAALEVAPAAVLPLVEIKRMTVIDRPLIDRMRAVVSRPDVSVMERVAVHFGLGKAFDDLGDWSDAIRHYQQGNDLRAMSARLDRGALVRHYDSLIADFSNGSLARAAQSLGRPARPVANWVSGQTGSPSGARVKTRSERTTYQRRLRIISRYSGPSGLVQRA